jgi:hypothetical protein
MPEKAGSTFGRSPQHQRMVKVLLHDLAATYVTVAVTCPCLYSQQQAHLRVWRTWHSDKPVIR